MSRVLFYLFQYFQHPYSSKHKKKGSVKQLIEKLPVVSFLLTLVQLITPMFRNNKNLLIIALIAVVNALGYGIVIPILYSYSKHFGFSDFENGLLFSIF